MTEESNLRYKNVTSAEGVIDQLSKVGYEHMLTGDIKQSIIEFMAGSSHTSKKHLYYMIPNGRKFTFIRLTMYSGKGGALVRDLMYMHQRDTGGDGTACVLLCFD